MDVNEFARAFDKPVGYYIQGDNELRQWKPSVLSFGYSFANVKSRLILDSEQPRLELCTGGLLFTAEDCDFHFARERIELVSIGVSSNTDPTTLDGLRRPFGSIDSASLGPQSQSLRILQETSCQRRTASASQQLNLTEGDFKAKGCQRTVLNDETLVDFVIDHYGLLSRSDGSEHKILITTMPNTLPIDEQIKALTTAGTKACVYGDKPGNHRAGFSLSRTVLAHGTELHVTSPDYFVLTIEPLSSLPSDLAKQRLQYVRDFCHLDPNQEETFTKSTTKYRGNYESRFEGRFQQANWPSTGDSILGSTTGFLTRVSHENFARNMCQPCCAWVGPGLIQCSSGTGKTTTAVAIVLAMMALQVKVLLTATSKKSLTIHSRSHEGA
ncbi:hypothetical protein PENFLA_c043G05506 [Penicillium flavigenum]|uniref:DNA2/NAM7 helicase helicase domain-containing protein n=1 Tax=Penicillium flavigenum TaxID=254877 RepID=A0A1V6SJ57_9EURO|nr:hypothetical protein PENFLA_c043G05506 [Penicillium flavigenum]